MRGNSHVRFLGEERLATVSPYPIIGGCYVLLRIFLYVKYNPYRFKVKGDTRRFLIFVCLLHGNVVSFSLVLLVFVLAVHHSRDARICVLHKCQRGST